MQKTCFNFEKIYNVDAIISVSFTPRRLVERYQWKPRKHKLHWWSNKSFIKNNEDGTWVDVIADYHLFNYSSDSSLLDAYPYYFIKRNAENKKECWAKSRVNICFTNDDYNRTMSFDTDEEAYGFYKSLSEKIQNKTKIE